MQLPECFDEATLDRCTRLMELLIGSPHNLTSIKNLERAKIIHVEDTLKPFCGKSLAGRFIDIGSGGGIPGLIMAIAYPETEWVLLDSTKKKIGEIERFSRALEISNATPIAARAEEYALETGERFDGAFLRAVARGDVALELAAPLVRKGGSIYMYKGPGWQEEKERAVRAAEKLNLSLDALSHYSLSDGSPRSFVTFRKDDETPSLFPRKTGLALKFPLGE